MSKSIIVPERKFKIGDEDLTFRFDFKALLKFEEVFAKEGISGLYAYLAKGEKLYETGIRILVASCIDKELTFEEVAESLPLDISTIMLFDSLLTSLLYGVTRESEESNEDNDSLKKKLK